MEKRFEGRALAYGVVLAERVSAVGGFAHALAFCQAAEQAGRCAVPPRARMLRSLLAELERLYNHLHYFGHLCNTTTLKVGEAEGKLLEERAKQINGKLTGSRFLRGLMKPGGLRRDLKPGSWLSEALEDLREDVAKYLDKLENTDSHLDRLITTGVLSTRVARDQGATGPIARASGVDLDLRRDHPYAAYRDLPLTVPVKTSGDAHARAQVRMAEIDASFALMQRILLLLAGGPIAVECRSAARLGGPRMGRIAARRALLRRSFRRRRRLGARQDQVAVVFELARLPVHRARQQHDGLRHQRGELRPHHRGLRSLGRRRCRFGLSMDC